jgi:tyrosyl-tRNA synthetase
MSGIRLEPTAKFAAFQSVEAIQNRDPNQEGKYEEDHYLATHFPHAQRSLLSLEEKMALALSVGEECIRPDELEALFLRKEHPVVYDGFEPSGRMHIAQGVQRAINTNKLTSCGCLFKFWVADWFAMLNNKLGGDLHKIREVGQYFIEIWKAVGMNMNNVEFLWASDEINNHAEEYWAGVLDISTRNSLTRIKRCCTIMGRDEDENSLSSSMILYPIMQCNDIFFLKADICQLGMDQRKVNMLAREYSESKKMRHRPIILSHHMLAGLKEGQEEMSKRDPDSAIFMEDTEAQVKKKIKKAFCPPGVLEKNPVIEYVRYCVFPYFGTFAVSRRDEGDTLAYNQVEDFEADFEQELLHPGDVKQALIEALNRILQPVRDHFKEGEMRALLERVQTYRNSS